MGNAIAKVLFLLLIIAYCALFIQWNGEPTFIRGAVAFGQAYGYTLALGWWMLMSAGVGAIVMAIATWSQWTAQKHKADSAAATVENAKAKLQELADKIKQQRQEIAELKEAAAGQLQPAADQPEANEDSL